jgi:uncharacterized membrane protein
LHQTITKEWTKNYKNSLRRSFCFILVAEAELIFKDAKRVDYINLYKSELNKDLSLNDTFHVTHKLEFYGHFDQ